MQSLAPTVARLGIRETFQQMVQQESIKRPFKGIGAVVIGAGPSHALYFSCYEYLKETLVQKSATAKYHTLIYGNKKFTKLLSLVEKKKFLSTYKQ